MSRGTSNDCPSPVFLRLAVGYVYLHFGLLKFFPDLSPAELIATQTIMALSNNLLDATTAQLYLAILETTIGLGMVFQVFPRTVFVLFMLHMLGTFMPIVYLPEYSFKIAPFAPTIEGQYVLKNLVFVAAGWTVLWPQLVAQRKAKATPDLKLVPQAESPTTVEVEYEEVLA